MTESHTSPFDIHLAAIDAAKISRRRRQREAAVARPEPWFAQERTGARDAEQAVAALKALPIDEREAIVAHIEKGFAQAERGELIDGDAAVDMLRQRRAERLKPEG